MRLQFTGSGARVAQIQEAMRKCDFRTKQELFDNAMDMFLTSLAEVEAGATVKFQKDGSHGQKELIMPWMLRVRNNKEATQ